MGNLAPSYVPETGKVMHAASTFPSARGFSEDVEHGRSS
jgi:hypothetical protein